MPPGLWRMEGARGQGVQWSKLQGCTQRSCLAGWGCIIDLYTPYQNKTNIYPPSYYHLFPTIIPYHLLGYLLVPTIYYYGVVYIQQSMWGTRWGSKAGFENTRTCHEIHSHLVRCCDGSGKGKKGCLVFWATWMQTKFAVTRKSAT